MGDDCVRFFTVVERSRLAGGCASLSDKCSSDVESLSSSEINIQRWFFFVRRHERFFCEQTNFVEKLSLFSDCRLFVFAFLLAHCDVSWCVPIAKHRSVQYPENCQQETVALCMCIAVCLQKRWRQIMDPLGKTLPYSIVFLVCCSAIVDKLCSLIVLTDRILKWSDPVKGPISC